MSYYLFLDDMRMPGDVSWARLPGAVYKVVRSYDEFVAYINENGIPEFVSFDHDLADQHYVAMLAEVEGRPADYGDEKSGYDAAKWLVEYCYQNECDFPKYMVHSMNPVGKERIIAYIENANMHYKK